MLAQVWSEGKDKFVEIALTTEQHRKVTEFIDEYKDGTFFDSGSVDDLFTEDQIVSVDTGTQALIAAFLPAGLGCVQHGTDDFAIEETP